MPRGCIKCVKDITFNDEKRNFVCLQLSVIKLNPFKVDHISLSFTFLQTSTITVLLWLDLVAVTSITYLIHTPSMALYSIMQHDSVLAQKHLNLLMMVIMTLWQPSWRQQTIHSVLGHQRISSQSHVLNANQRYVNLSCFISQSMLKILLLMYVSYDFYLQHIESLGWYIVH